MADVGRERWGDGPNIPNPDGTRQMTRQVYDIRLRHCCRGSPVDRDYHIGIAASADGGSGRRAGSKSQRHREGEGQWKVHVQAYTVAVVVLKTAELRQ